MPTPEQIGRVRFTEARAVQVREADNIKEVHSAVHGTVCVYTDTMTEAKLLIESWNEIMQAANDKVDEILAREKVMEG